MRISHKKRKPEPKKLYRFNKGILSPKVMVLDIGGQNLGVMNTGEAIRLAQGQELDLVEINPKTDPPVAKIIDYGQFQYQQEKEARLRKAHQHVIKLKGIRLSLRIGKHDLEIRKNQTLKFLNEGNKVKIEIILRGRENQRAPLAFEIIKNFVANLNAATPVKLEQEASRQGNIIAAIVIKT